MSWGTQQWGQTQWGGGAAGPATPSVGDPTRAKLGALFTDAVDLNTSTTTPVLCCRNPLPNQTGVKIDADIELTILDLGSTGLSKDAKIWVTTNSVQTLVYDQGVGSTAAGWSVVETNDKSLSSTVDDISIFVLSHTSDFISEETVLVEVTATTIGLDNLSDDYEFNVEDVIQPHLQEAKVRDFRQVRVEFTEPVQQDSTAGTALCIRDISTRVKFTAPNIIEAPLADFTTSDIGLFVGVHGATKSKNNGSHEILNILSPTQVEVDASIDNENVSQTNTPTVVVTCYRVVHIAPSLPEIEPAFEPIVIAASAVDSSSIAPGEDTAKYVDLTFQDDLTPQVDYYLEAKNILDLSGNVIGSQIQFTSWTPFAIPDREFDLWENFTPQVNKREDQTQDLERVIKSFNEATKVLLRDVDQFGLLKDPDSTRENVLDTLLDHLGNPFSFVQSLSAQKKRELIPLLVPIYKQKGIEDGIIDSVLFFLGPNVSLVRILPFWDPSSAWTLGESELGIDTYLAAPSSFLRYAFEVEVTSDEVLTTEEKEIISEIVDFVRPAHTHYVRLVEIVI